MEIPVLRGVGRSMDGYPFTRDCCLDYKKNDQGQLVVKAGDQLRSATFNAQELVKEITATHGGGGGGRKTMAAQAGGVNLSQLDAVLQSIQHYLANHV